MYNLPRPVLSSSKNKYRKVFMIGTFPTPHPVVHSGCSVNAFGFLSGPRGPPLPGLLLAFPHPTPTHPHPPPLPPKVPGAQPGGQHTGRKARPCPRHSQPSWERLTRYQTKCGVNGAWQSVPGCHGSRGGSLLCALLSAFQRTGCEGGGGWWETDTEKWRFPIPFAHIPGLSPQLSPFHGEERRKTQTHPPVNEAR